MAKNKSTAQLKAQAINEAEKKFREKLAKQNEEIENLKGQIKQLEEKRFEQRKQIQSLNTKLQELELIKEQVDIVKDWNTRLMNYMDLPYDDFQKVLDDMKKEKQAMDSLRNLTNMYTRVFGSIL